MTSTLILYGSRARGDARPGSDVDLLLVPDNGPIEKPIKFSGLSLHTYPKNWLLKNARNGDLFAYHVASEGVPLKCAKDLLVALKEAFCWKATYQKERATALAVITLLSRTSWGWNDSVQRRFFWAVRTLALTLQAERKAVNFSLRNIDASLGLDGYSKLFERRDNVSYDECIAMGAKLFERYDRFRNCSSSYIADMLLAQGGIGFDTVKAFETEQAIDSGSLAIYL